MRTLVFAGMALMALSMGAADAAMKTKYPTPRTTAQPTAPTTPVPTVPTSAPTFNPGSMIGNGTMFRAFKVADAIFASGFEFFPNGQDILYAETLGGTVKVADTVMHTISQIWSVPGFNVTGSDSGDTCVGVTIHKDYPVKPYAYIYCSVSSVNNLYMLTLDPSTKAVQSYKIILSFPAFFENGGPLKFRKSDGKLYLVTGYEVNPPYSQNLTIPMGKILRMNDDGSIPEGNPFKDSLIWSYGHRNPFGLAFDPVKDNIWSTENGPECNDEINLIVKGANFGWGPKAKCPKTNNSGPKVHKPKYTYKVSRGIVGAAFDKSNNLIVGSFNLFTIDCVVLTKDRTGVKEVMLGAYVHPQSEANILQVKTNDATGDVYFSSILGIFKLVPKPLM